MSEGALLERGVLGVGSFLPFLSVNFHLALDSFRRRLKATKKKHKGLTNLFLKDKFTSAL